MDHTLLFKVILPSDTIAAFNAEMVVVPGQEGVFGVLPGHAGFTSSVNIGIIDAQEKGIVRRFFVYGGVAQVTGRAVNIVTEFAVDLEGAGKNDILNKITELKNQLMDQEKGSTEAGIINAKIEKYQSLIEFIA